MTPLKLLAIESWSWAQDPQPVASALQRWARPETTVHRIGLDIKRARLPDDLGAPTAWARRHDDTVYTPHGLFDDTLPPDTAPVSVAATVEMVVWAERQGYDAAFVPCFADTGVVQARSQARIPVVGACYASLHLASLLGQSFSVIVNFPVDIPHFVATAEFYGVEAKLRSFRSVDMSTRERSADFSRGDPAESRKRLIAAARQAIEVDGAEVIVGGCTSQGWLEWDIQEELGVPVIDAGLAALKVAELMADLWHNFRLSHSRVGYYFPRGTFFG